MGGRLFDGYSRGLSAHLVCHCLLIETNDGLVLIDTGYGSQDITRPRERLSDFFLALNRPQLLTEETAVAQIRRLGFAPADVRHIVVTHLDFDHAGGIEDFPNARIHVTAREKEVADQRRGGVFVSRKRYRPQQWDEAANWSLYPFGGGERWFGFDAVRDLEGLPPEILLIPLAGHTWGHAGIAVQEDDGRWLFYAGDAYFHHGEINGEHRTCPPGLRGYQRLMQVDADARMANQRRVHTLSTDHADAVRIFCAHDLVEFQALAGAP
ncbi:MBL fold metallo-hydrolase [Sphingomonas sp. BK481]|uniref:MBL fold metallo-hydrolase n=1 Tax=Sphingomonas sp. BK481 TaxID=2586981 RepID=UPI0018401CBB|nr:MBL fold metallo-hydrolase [Sphingomonas sp. BK481]MBB3589231.1 glyoxylase-like metal-dependent hydrolase (beta-lactamase superfamily II) [Sphingomonas sp. BK481]